MATTDALGTIWVGQDIQTTVTVRFDTHVAPLALSRAIPRGSVRTESRPEAGAARPTRVRLLDFTVPIYKQLLLESAAAIAVDMD